ncbi:Indigoidine synthase A-like protein [Sarcoptes scabiei]|uniref:Indigoidine synthase A-like protein n=1 Tax=Sarcoptes scabiei TaxID=52283 RepID=A0A132ADX9_SARSC|nr:Indigoidine synthase A-like protein [Sarcoptes scabiei]
MKNLFTFKFTFKQKQFSDSNDSVPLLKVSRGDLSICLHKGWSGGTTVSATSYISDLVGIKIFVTGGIGGVHREAETTFDISADLEELSRTPTLIVSAGIKSILDIEKTLEVLETKGVCVAVYQGESTGNINRYEFPAFFTPNSGLTVSYNFDTTKSVAELMLLHEELELKSGILLAVPNRINDQDMVENQEKIEKALQIALEEIG